jgi:hypothetical protein
MRVIIPTVTPNWGLYVLESSLYFGHKKPTQLLISSLTVKAKLISCFLHSNSGEQNLSEKLYLRPFRFVILKNLILK